MIVSSNEKTLKHTKHLSTQAKADELFFEHDEVGYNYRLSSLQAAVGIAQLERLNEFIQIKRKIYENYRALLAEQGIGKLIAEPEGSRSNYWLCSMVLDPKVTQNQRAIIASLEKEKIQIRPIWKLNHEQVPFQKFQSYQIEAAQKIHPRVLNLPSSTTLTEADQLRVVQALKTATR